MVDLVGIGVSGLSAYQQALATTSNNIANLQTEGYVRQRVSLQSAGQDNLSRISLGNGVRLAEIERLYDRFAEENLQRASSDLKGQETLLSQLQSLQDSIGSSDAGLHGALQAFFDSARALEAAPAAAGARAGFLAAADGVSARMRGLGGTVQSLEANSRTQIEQDVSALNSYLQEIATLNKELLKRSNSAEQPMQLLDRRDATLKKISELIGITVATTSGGAASIYAGDSAAGVALVEGSETHSVSAQFDAVDYGRVQFVLDAASRPTVLPTVRNGSLGGLVTFRSQSLGVAADTLDNIALSFGRGVNRLHREGLDAQGMPGGDLFYVGPKFTVDGKANAGAGRLGVEVVDAEIVQAHSYKMSFDANAQLWTVRDQSTGQIASGANDLLLGGLKFNVQGMPKNGDTFVISPEARPSLTFQTLVRDTEKVATASKATVSSAPTNVSTAVGDIGFGAPRAAEIVRSISEILPRTSGPPYIDTYFSKSSRPIASIPAGTSNVVLTTGASDGELAVFTRDGRQISGPDLTSLKSSIVTKANGFYDGAVYSAAYLNAVGEDAYLDHGFVSGAYAIAGSQKGANGDDLLTPATLIGDAVDLATLPNTFSLRINGKTVAINLTGVTSDKLQAIKTQVNASSATTGAVVEVLENGKAVTSGGDRLVFKTAGKAAVGTLSAGASPSVTINGTVFEASSTPDLVTAINAAKIGVTASASGSTLTLANSYGQAGQPFKVRSDAYGLDEQTYYSSAPLSVEFDPAVSSSSALTALGLRRGFAMADALGEDLLVFGVKQSAGSSPELSAVSVAGSYDAATRPADLFGPGKTPSYSLVFGDSNAYTLVDDNTGTEVSAGTFDDKDRTIRYGDWQVTFDGIPVKGDTYSITKTDAPLGDNRIAAAIARLQHSRELTGTDQTLQEQYESLVNRTGALTVQAEIGKNAQKVVFDHSLEARDRVSGVNLDEELSDLLRYQQAYQANAQVIQVATRLFDALMQKL